MAIRVETRRGPFGLGPLSASVLLLVAVVGLLDDVANMLVAGLREFLANLVRALGSQRVELPFVQLDQGRRRPQVPTQPPPWSRCRQSALLEVP
jgi:hypothetical protein